TFCHRSRRILLPHDLGKLPHFVEGVVERHWGYAHDVGLAKVADHAFPFESCEEIMRTVTDEDRKLASSLAGIARCDYLEPIAGKPVEKELQIPDQPFRLGPQFHHAGFFEDRQRGPQGHHGQDRRIAYLPTFRPGLRHEWRVEVHLE